MSDGVVLTMVNDFLGTRFAGADTLSKPINTAQKRNATRSAFLSLRSKGPISENGNIVQRNYAERARESKNLALSHVFPVPRFVEVRTKSEALRVLNKPSIGWSVDLDRAVGVFRINGIAADI